MTTGKPVEMFKWTNFPCFLGEEGISLHMLKTARLIITGILLTGQLLSCRERPENPYVVTTTEQHPWMEASGYIPSADAVQADLVLDLAGTGQTVEGFGMCFSELSLLPGTCPWNTLPSTMTRKR